MKKRLVMILFAFVIFLSVFLFTNCKSTSFPILGQGKVFQDNLYKEYLNLGDGYYQIERYNDAISFYKRVLEDKKLEKIAYYKIAQCYAYLSDWNNALPMYEKMLSEDPDNQSIMANIAYIYSMKGDTEQALSSYEKLLSLQPSNITYLENYLAIILSDEKIFEKNIEAFETVFTSLKENYPKNQNIETFQKKYDEFKNILKEKEQPDAKEDDSKTSSDAKEQTGDKEKSSNTNQKDKKSDN